MDREPRFLNRLKNASDREALKVLYATIKRSGDKKKLHKLRKFVSLAYAFGGTNYSDYFHGPSYFIDYDSFIQNLTKPGSRTLDYAGNTLFDHDVKDIFVI